jgi:pyruvate, water dikinase
MRSSPSASRLISLDDPAAARLAGGKAAALAQARRAGLPVPPGYVVPAAEGAAALRAGQEAPRPRARHAVFSAPVGEQLVAGLAGAVRRLGGRVIVRSSSVLEPDPRWSGAFSSIREVGPGDVAVAVRSCWASLFAPGALERLAQAGLEPADAGLSLLVQPDLEPESGGLARACGPETEVTWVAGHPGAMLAGAADGESVRVGPSGGVAGPDGILRQVARLARAVRDVSGHEVIEWAWAGGRLHLLQCGPGRPATRPAPAPDRDGGIIRLTGTACVPGDATGRLRYVRPGQSAPDGHILVAARPLAALAPLLFGARGIVCRSGPSDCHLASVAGALGVPMLVQACLDPLGPLDSVNQGHGWLGVLSGHRGELAVTPAGA